METLLAATDRLGERLAEVPVPTRLARSFASPGYVDVWAVFAGWAEAAEQIADLPHDLVPPLVRRQASRCRDVVRGLLAPGSPDLAHWDIRNDNLLARPDGSIVFVDWGACAVGPRWVDPLLARLERADSPWFDESAAASEPLAEAGEDHGDRLAARPRLPPGAAYDDCCRRRAAHAQRVPAYGVAPYPGGSGATPGFVIWGVDRPAGIFFPRVCGPTARARRLRSTPDAHPRPKAYQWRTSSPRSSGTSRTRSVISATRL
jgi:hypothetical protein